MKRVGLGLMVLGMAGCDAAAVVQPIEDVATQSYWDWQLGEPLNLSRDVQVLDVEPDAISPAQVAQMNARGVQMICYVSVGTIENYRDDVGDFPASVVGRTYGDWPDEKFLDVRQLDVLLPLMQARFQRCKDMGFDAIEPDNMDVYDNESGFALTRADGVRYIRALAELAHGMGLRIGQKNVPELTGDLVASLDFVITEDCFNDGWCDAVLPYARAGKDVLAAEYTDTGVDWGAACTYGAANDVHMILKNRDLSAALQTCP